MSDPPGIASDGAGAMEAIVRGILAAFVARDGDALSRFLSPDVVLDDSGPESVLQGRAEVLEWLGGPMALMTGGTSTVRGFYFSRDGTKVAVEWHDLLQHRDVPEPIEMESIHVFEFSGGLISRWTIFFRDREWMGRQWP